jgi:hypothetical protein
MFGMSERHSFQPVQERKMPPISGLNTFTSPVDPMDLDANFTIVQTAFNDSAIRDDEQAVQSLDGPLEGILRDTEFAKSVKLSTIGAVGDGVKARGAISLGSNVLTATTGVFSSADIGKPISVVGAGPTDHNLVTTIVGVSSPTAATQATLAASATVPQTDTEFTFGTNDAPEFGALTAGTYLVPAGLYVFSTSATVEEGVVLVFAEGARLTRVGGPTLAFHGEIVAGRTLVFDVQANFLVGSRPRNRTLFPEWWGVKGDTATAAGGTMTLGSYVLTTSAAAFSPADVGKRVEVPNAGTTTGSVTAPLATRIAGYTSATQVTLTDPAVTATPSPQLVTFGTDDTIALNQALLAAKYFTDTAAATGANGGAVVSLRPATYLVGGPDYVDLVSNVTLTGAGSRATVLKNAAEGTLGITLRLLGVENVAVENVTVENIGFDYSGGGAGSIIELRGTNVRDITVRGCRFFDSSPIEDADPIADDRFAITFSSDDPLERIRVIDNECRDRLQLTAAGGAGVKYLWIERNYVEHAEQNAIAVSTLANNAVFEYVYIRGNYIKDTHQVGIYVGEDRTGRSGQTFRFIYIVDNVIDGFGFNSEGNNTGIYCTAVDTECADYEIRGNVVRGWPATQHSGIVMTNRVGGERRFRRVTVADNKVEGFERGMRIDSVHEGTLSGNILTGGVLDEEEDIVLGGIGIRFDGADLEKISLVGNRSSGFIFGCSIQGGTFDLVGNSLGNNTLNDPFHPTAALYLKPTTGQTARVNAVGNFLGDDQATHTQEYGIYHDPAATGSFDCRYVDNDLRGITVSGGELYNVDHNQRVLDNHTSVATGLVGPRWERVATASLTFSAPGAVPGESAAGATVTVTGARAGDTVQVTAPGAISTGFVAPYGWVSANDTVTVVWMQVAGTAAAAPSGTYRVRVTKF